MKLALVVMVAACAACVVPPVASNGAAGGTVGGATDGEPVTRDAEPTGRYAQVITELHARINATREAQGARVLVLDDALNRAADGHARELALRGVLTHESIAPGRHSMTDRIDAAGGTWLRAAENLVRVAEQQDSVPGLAVELWLSSAGHRRNLLEPVYSHTGVGVARDDGGQWFIVQLFTLPRGGS